MKSRVYLETTIPSYLTAWPSRDLIRAAHQQSTREWWDRRDEYELFISQLVVEECLAGDQTAASARASVLSGLMILGQSEASQLLAHAILDGVPLPRRATADGIHIAIAAVHGLDHLLTWNCTHIANATLRRRTEAVCQGHGFDPPAICTPEELASGGHRDV